MNGKKRCKILKELRQKIAEQNDIAFVTAECRHKGDCAGTCPKCEAEVRYLERELEKRARLGKTLTVAGIAAGVALASLGCASSLSRENGGSPGPADLSVPSGPSAVPSAANGLTEIDLMGDPVGYPDETDSALPSEKEEEESYRFYLADGSLLFDRFPPPSGVLSVESQAAADAFLSSLSRSEMQKRWMRYTVSSEETADHYSGGLILYYGSDGRFSHAEYPEYAFSAPEGGR